MLKWIVCASVLAASALQPASPLPAGPLSFGGFIAAFAADGTFTLEGEGWPAFKGTWKADGGRDRAARAERPRRLHGPGRYRFRVDDRRLTFDLVVRRLRAAADDSRSQHVAAGRRGQGRRRFAESSARSPTGRRCGRRPATAPAAGRHSADHRRRASPRSRGCPTPGTSRPARTSCGARRFPASRTRVPIVWGDRIFVTTAISSRPNATFRPGLYGDGDASDDRSRQRWMIYAIDKRTGKTLWERVAHEGEPLNKRHIKSTYASASPATDGRIVVAWFGSQGVYAYDLDGTSAMEGRSRPRRHGRVRHSDVRVGSGELADHLERSRDPAVSTRRPIRSCSRSTPTPARPCGRPNATSCRRGARRRWR